MKASVKGIEAMYMLAFFTSIFVVIFSLYKLEIEAVLYAVGLCIVFTIVLYSIRFWVYCKEYQQRQQLLKRIEFEYEKLSEAKKLVEEDYQQMISIIGETNCRHLTE